MRFPITICLILLAVLSWPSVLPAITISAPTSVQLNQSVSVAITSVFPSGPTAGCEFLTVNYGDGTLQTASVGACTPSPTSAAVTCTQTVSHPYTTAGLFTISVSGCPALAAPNPGTLLVNVSGSPLSLSSSPSTLSVTRGNTGSGVITYRAGGTGNATLYSDRGNFIVGGEVVGTNPAPLTMAVTNGSGMVTESVVLPVRLGEIALQRGQNSYVYSRSFASGAGPTFNTAVTVNLTTSAAASFSIQRLELFFTGNKRGEITVQRNHAGLRAAAAISYTGSGLLQGRWEVDGRIIGRVFQHLTFGDTLTLEMPAGVTLPTFDPGNHTVRFVIENPAVAFEMPLLIYFVTPDEALPPLGLKLPVQDAVLPYAPSRFEWQGLPDAKIYLIRFLPKSGTEQLFSAYTTTPVYTLPEPALKGYFSAGQSYTWEVRALDGKGEVISASPAISFAFKPLP